MLIPLGILDYPVGAAGVAAYDLLETEILTGSQASVTFSSGGVWADYQHLQIRATVRTDRSPINYGICNLIFNSDTTSSYANHEFYGTDGSVQTDANTSDANIRVALRGAGLGSAANSFGAGVVDILDINSTNKNTTIRTLTGSTDEAIIGLGSGAYFKTDAITSLTLSPEVGSNIVTGSRFSLYGLKASA